MSNHCNCYPSSISPSIYFAGRWQDSTGKLIIMTCNEKYERLCIYCYDCESDPCPLASGSDDPQDPSFVLIRWTHRNAAGRATTGCCALCKSLLQRGWQLDRYKEFRTTDREDGGKQLYLDAVLYDVATSSDIDVSSVTRCLCDAKCLQYILGCRPGELLALRSTSDKNTTLHDKLSAG